MGSPMGPQFTRPSQSGQTPNTNETQVYFCSIFTFIYNYNQCPLEDRFFLLHNQVWDIGRHHHGDILHIQWGLGDTPMANTATSVTSGTFLIHDACYFYLLQIGLFFGLLHYLQVWILYNILHMYPV